MSQVTKKQSKSSKKNNKLNTVIVHNELGTYEKWNRSSGTHFKSANQHMKKYKKANNKFEIEQYYPTKNNKQLNTSMKKENKDFNVEKHHLTAYEREMNTAMHYNPDTGRKKTTTRTHATARKKK